MSEFWHPPISLPPSVSPSAACLHKWHNQNKDSRYQQYIYALANINILVEPSKDPQPSISDSPETGAQTLSGQKRKAIKLEQAEVLEIQRPSTYPVWHPSFPYCSVCLDLTIVKKEDLDN
jgi:hypothetical protein